MTVSGGPGGAARLAMAAALLAGCGLSEFPHPMATGPTDQTGGSGGPAGTGGSGGALGTTDGGLPAGGDDAGGGVDTGAPGRDAATTDPTPGPGVVIDGKMVARENVIVFLHIGHSNMAGRTATPAALRPLNFETHPNLWAYAAKGMWRLAKEPLSGDYLTKSNNAGPGMSILRTALALSPQRIMVSIGRGHDGSIGGHCRNFRKGALLYDFVMGPAMELKGKVSFGGIFAMLGVNEFRRDLANLPRFNECLAGIAADMRTDLGDPNIPFVLGDWEAGATGDFDPTKDYAVTTREQMRIAMTKIPRAVLIPTEMLPMSDDHHYDMTGYKLWAERGFDLMKKASLVPWAN